MATTNLFGQNYTSNGSSKYANYKYVCSGADDGTNNTIQFGTDSEGNPILELVDSNGNKIASMDLSSVKANPINDYRSGSMVMNGNEARLLEGLEFGKSYKKLFFKVPNDIIEMYGQDVWEDYVNVKFCFLFNASLDLREYQIKTIIEDAKNVKITKRIQNLLNDLGLEDKVAVALEDVVDSNGVPNKYITFTSLVLGYDFIVMDFSYLTSRFSYYVDEDGDRVEIDVNQVVVTEPGDGKSMEMVFGAGGSRVRARKTKTGYTFIYTSSKNRLVNELEDNVVFKDGTIFKEDRDGLGFNLGHYDNEDWPEDDRSAKHFYYGGTYSHQSDVDEPDASDNDSFYDEASSDDFYAPDDSSDVVSDEWIDDRTEEIITQDGTVIYIVKETEYLVESDKCLDVHAFKYVNGAARVWFIVPEFPTEIEDTNFTSLKLNHVKDRIVDYVPEVVKSDDECECDCCGEKEFLYKRRYVDVYALEKNEAERHSLYKFKDIMTEEYKITDTENGTITPVVHHFHHHHDRPCMELGVHNPHIGMYRYLENVEVNGEWTNFGQFYGIVTNADSPEDNVRNLANSVFIYNNNDFPIKINYFVGV